MDLFSIDRSVRLPYLQAEAGSRGVTQAQRATLGYLPARFNVPEALEYGRLVICAYQQYASAVARPVGHWTLPEGYRLEREFFGPEEGVMLPFGFVCSKDRVCHVAIRGTRTPLEWLDDASICPAEFEDDWGLTTVGFKRLHDQIWPQIQEFSVGGEAGRFDRLVITGHSLGSALANLVAAEHARRGARGDQLAVYTFSSPRVGDPTFAARFNAAGFPAWRVFNTEDLVPTLPLSTVLLGSGTEVGLFESRIELVLKLLLKETPFMFQHVDVPVAVTYQAGSLDANHDLARLLKVLQG